MPVQKTMDVIIVGGSLAGLYSGVVLSRLGHNVTILERYPASSMKDQGAGLSAACFLPALFKSFKSLGTSGNPVIDLLSKHDRTKIRYFRDDVTSLRWQFLKRDGSIKDIKLFQGTDLAATSWELLYNILRANFDGMYKEGYVNAAPKEIGDGKTEYIYETQVTNIHEAGGLVEVQFVDSNGKTRSRTCNLVIGADGASSTVRRLLLPEAERTYSGYATWRGTIEADKVSPGTRELLDQSFTQFYSRGYQVVHYPIPGYKGALAPHKQYFNIVWYCNYAPNSPELNELLTDVSGRTHQFSLPVNSVQPALVRRQHNLARRVLPPPLFEVFGKVEKPFVTAITDNLSSKGVFLNGKVLLVGDAISGNRPHTGAGSSQAAMHALLLHRVFKEQPDMTLAEWEEKICRCAKETNEIGVQMGNLSQFGSHPMADDREPMALL